ncbi:MAG: nucleotidyl transferase AbiEii/AbiGii toxin family protein [Patescibacteria group bacterium]
MAQKVEKGTGLSLRQEQFLAVVLQTGEILKQFYLSGGTALSSWYLHHRESYDLDFFSDQSFDGEKIAQWIRQHEKQLHHQAFVVNDDFGFYTFLFRYPDNSRFKVDFAHYTAQRITKGMNWKGLEIDSMYEIAVNKIHTIRTHPRERDYVDLYCILKKTNWSIDKLLIDADRKFDATTDILQVAKHFLKAAEITNYPKMLIPFDEHDMYDFYEKLAKKLKSKILK